MTFVRAYRMRAADGRADELKAALVRLADKLHPIAGFLGWDILDDVAQPAEVTFVEKWESIDLHAAGSTLLPKDAFAPVMAALAGKPQASWLRLVATGSKGTG